MTEKNDFKLDVVSIRLVKEAPIYSEQSFNKPEEVAAVMGDDIVNIGLHFFHKDVRLYAASCSEV